MMRYSFSKNQELNLALNKVIHDVTLLAEQQEQHIQSLTRIGEALSSAADIHRIFDLILDEAVAYTNADAFTIYRVSDDLKFLDFATIFTRSTNWRMGGKYGPITWPSIPLYEADGNPRLMNISANVYHKKRLLVFDDVYETVEYDTSGTRNADKMNKYRSKSMLTIPLKNHEDEVLGVLQIINAMDELGNVIPFSNDHILMVKSLASQAAIAMSNRKLIIDLEELLFQFVRSIAKAIGRKTKYTLNHIDKVAAFTEILADSINRDKHLQFKDTHFNTNELKEISLSGWMHDVGKIITPEAVMDKSTKLETIVDRIELVRLRFSLFKQALELYRCTYSDKRLLTRIKKWAGYEDCTSVEELLQRLDGEMAFIEKSNTGGEFLPDANIARIRNFGNLKFTYNKQTWFILTEDEVKNLLIRAGTLTDEERKIINDHAMTTWVMLSELSFPKKYKNVALYASSHHEKLNGKGYPRGLNADQLPLQARIIAVADIFEALTAADRPYKKAKLLSESLEIMAKMVKFQELDANIMDFFLDSGLYKRLAQRYLKKEQRNEIDITAMKKIYHPDMN